MKLRAKLSIAFLLVSIIPMVIAVYLAIRVNINLLQTGLEKQLYAAVPFVEQSKQQYLTRTGFAARSIVKNPKIIPAILDRDSETLQTEIGKVVEGVKVNEVVYLKPVEVLAFVPKGKKIQTMPNPIWQGFLPPEIDPKYGLMVVTISKIEYKGKLLGGIRVGYQFEKNIVEGIIAATGLNAAIFPKNSPTLKKIANAQMLNALFKLGQTYYTNDILMSNVHYQALSLPLKSSTGEVTAVVFLGLPQQPMEELWNRYRNTFYLFTIAFGSLFAIIIALIVARTIAKPVHLLSDGAEQIAADNLEVRIQVKSRDELGELAQSFNRMASKLLQNRQLEAQMRLKDKLASLGQLSAGMAHEVRNPLSSIKVSAELMQRKFAEGDQEHKQLQYIINDVDRMNTLIADFLTFAKPREPNMVKCKVELIVDRTLALAHSQLIKKPFHIDWKNNTGPEDYFAADTNQIQQVFLNLILNACQSMPNGGTITIIAFRTTATENPMLGISFTDEGVGIPKEMQSKIFDPFFTTKEEGTGLGLAMAHQIIEAHHGKIELNSELNKGTTFTVYLPLVTS
jgi:two-component system, NtrC family, sensor histidine kinase HydH